MRLRNVLILCAIVAVPALAQDGSDPFAKRVELMAHQRLERLRLTPEAELVPFTTDGCSGGMSATWDMVARMFPEFAEIHMETPPWESCCVVHDQAYYLGGEDPTPEASYSARLAADTALRSCVQATSELRRDELKSQYDVSDTRIDQAYDLIAASMFDAVRVGGGPCSGLTWRWGYGWPQCGLFADW